ncbi:MAG: DUF4333 domain-containing protein [Streptosporangiaceae bacterium]
MSRRPTRTACTAACAAASAALLIAGCGPQQIDSHKAERAIAEGYEAQVDQAEVARVDCPDEVDGEVGTKAVCELTLSNGASGKVDISVVDEDGHIRWDVATAAR